MNVREHKKTVDCPKYVMHVLHSNPKGTTTNKVLEQMVREFNKNKAQVNS